ncbi:MAG TPA: NAD(P)/FAD-dependent oxidoreductase, partial [Steroidobacteraceae bacterium]|nr:NAD(P)/FAD-dependent oxidoreductase [Steroidobacteraceae bacterium]
MAINTEVVIVGAGPCGLFQVFELGLLGIKCHLLDSLAIPGGQCAELYPEKPIYDIPALPVCGAQELVDRLLEQIKPFGAQMHFGQQVNEVVKRADGRFDVRTAGGLEFDAGTIVIAGGVGSFQPRRLGVEGAEAFEGTQLFYRVKSAADFHGRHLVIFGGGDSALDWTLALVDKAASLTLVHRRAEFRAAPASVAKMQELVAAGRMRFIVGTAQSVQTTGERLSAVSVKDAAGEVHELRADSLLAFFGLAPKLGP